MTIYAIINHLKQDVSDNGIEEPIWSIISSAGILQGGNPYFVPDFADSFEARPALAVRIGRLGKGIARRFAYRYVESVAPALLFVADSLLDSLAAQGLPWTRAISYDRCLALGRFEEIPFEEISDCSIGLRLFDRKGLAVAENTSSFKGTDIGYVIESLSRDNTLKTGDIILAAIADSGPNVTPGLSARLSVDSRDSLRFNIR